MFLQFESTQKKNCWHWRVCFRPFFWSCFSEVKSFKEWEAACPLCMILDIFFLSWWLEYLVGYFRSARFLGSDVCTIVTICLVIRQSGEGCPCQEGGQGTNSFLFLDTSIYQAWLHASHTLQVGVHVCECFCVYVCWLEKDPCGWERNFTGRPIGCGLSKWCKIHLFLLLSSNIYLEY